MTRMAFGTVIVISAMPMPPLTMASAARKASSGEGARTMGTRPTSRMSARDFSLVQDIAVFPTIVVRTRLRSACPQRRVGVKSRSLVAQLPPFEVAALRPFRMENPQDLKSESCATLYRLARHAQACAFQQTLHLSQRRPIEVAGIGMLQGAERVAIADAGLIGFLHQ